MGAALPALWLPDIARVAQDDPTELVVRQPAAEPTARGVLGTRDPGHPQPAVAVALLLAGFERVILLPQLDVEEHTASQPLQSGRLSPPEAVAYLRSLPALWTDSGPAGRQALAVALFARTDVVGYDRMEYELTPDALELGLGAAFPAVFEFCKERGFGRGERGSPSKTQQSLRFLMINATPWESTLGAEAGTA